MADWALILGSSSGFGEAAALAFAEAGYNVYGVHLDRKSTLAHVDEVVGSIKEIGGEVEFFNINAADPEKRQEVVQHIAERLK
ncbi:MAG: SDR family NAD(P)-dependent oxidoreductase, partial [Gemmatimonadota bacterium]